MAFAHFGRAPAGFADTADMVFEVEGQRLPAHSQILAYHSQFVHKMLEDLSESETRQKPSRLNQFVIGDTMLSSYTAHDVQAYLCQIYEFGSKPVQSAEQAYQLLKVADRLDSPRLMEKCRDDLISRAPGLFQHDDQFAPIPAGPGALEWALRAEQYGLKDLQKKALEYVARNYQMLRMDDRLKQLLAAAFLVLADELHAVHVNHLVFNTGFTGPRKKRSHN